MRAVLTAFVVLGAAILPAAAIEGTYNGKGRSAGMEWMLQAGIAPGTAGRYKVIITATNDNCASQAEGIGRLTGRTLRVSGDCDLTVEVRKSRITIREAPNCAAYHGVSCSFDGTLEASSTP